MLHGLANYASKYDISCLPGFKSKTTKWIVVLTKEGQLLDVVPDQRDFLAPNLQQGELIASGIVRSHFLLDTLAVVTALDATERELLKHKFFIQLLCDASDVEPSLEKIAKALGNEETLKQIQEIAKSKKGRKADLVTIRLGDSYPIESDSWHDWWQQFRQSIGSSSDEQKSMICLLSGEKVKPLMTHSKITGLTRVGGQSTGCVLAGFDKDSFTSYGLRQSKNAACSETAVSVYAGALQDLIAKAPAPLAGTMFLSWYKEPISKEDDLLDFEALVNPDADESYARDRVEQLLRAIQEGQRPDLLNNRYYILQLSGSGGRIMIRDWLEGDYEELANNLRRWFEDLELVSPDGRGRAKDFKLFAALIRLVSYRKDERLGKTTERINDQLPPLMPKIWHSIFGCIPLPDTVASKSLAYIKSKLHSDEDSTGNLDRIGCALLKAWLVRRTSGEGGKGMQSHLNLNHPSSAYHAGRLMAVLASIQNSALGNVGAGVVQRYYAAASTTPALVLGRLVRGAQYHLDKLDKGLAIWYEQQLAQIMTQLGDDLPTTLTLQGQTLFALGYYQQQAAMFTKDGGSKTKE